MGFLQIASWNIEHLSGAPRKERRQSAYALTDHIEMSGIDLIALQEVYLTPTDEKLKLADNQPEIKSHATDNRRNSDLDVVCHLLEEHLDKPWAYQIIPNRTAGDRSQLCCVMWNTERLKLKALTPLNVPHRVGNDALWDRKPHVASFETDLQVWRKTPEGEWKRVKEKRGLSLIPLHMKSNFGGVTQNRAVRKKEADTLCAAINEVKAQIDPSIMLIGDTNILSNTEPAVETFVENGFIDLNNNDHPTYWSPQYTNGSPFDRVFIAKDRPEFRYTRQYVLRSSDLAAHDRYLSDHYMIKVSVKDYVDDAMPL